MKQIAFNPIIDSIHNQYIKYRKMGKSRNETIEFIRDKYIHEMQDPEDRIAVLIGLFLSLCKKKELVDSIAMETLAEIQHIKSKKQFHDAFLIEIEKRLHDKTMYGEEASYTQTSTYIPDWKIGDIFSHELTFPTSEELGIKGWFILFYKVGEYVDEFDIHHQLVFVSLCPPNNIPSCEQEFQELEFMQMICMGDKAEYLAQIAIKTKKDEEALALSKIGCFYNMTLPDNYIEGNPLTAMPLFGKVGRSNPWPGYEDQVCRLYKKHIKK